MIYDRRPRRHFVFPSIPLAGYVSAGVVLALALGLLILTPPLRMDQRVDALERQASILSAAALTPGDLEAYPVGVVCTTKVDSGFQNQLTGALANSGLTIDALDIRPEGRVGGNRPLMAYLVSVKATGSYEQALGGLDILAVYRPRLFLDSLTLRNQTDSVSLNLEGRYYCRSTQQS